MGNFVKFMLGVTVGFILSFLVAKCQEPTTTLVPTKLLKNQPEQIVWSE